MNEKELRELDVRVHLALWPEDEVKPGKETWARHGHGKLPSFFVLKGHKYVPVPHYTTDIGAWEPVYALKPEWEWRCLDYRDRAEIYLWAGASVMCKQSVIKRSEATGLSAWALGRARCVITWAAGRGEG